MLLNAERFILNQQITLFTVQQLTTTSFREKGSKFIGLLFPAASKEDFENQLDDIKSDYPDATHHCYAWRINPSKVQEFAQDDGEPSGTAGRPILNKLKSYEVINCGCVVVRYYGGTKLGTSGLIQAYGQSAEFCLQDASLHKVIPTHHFEINYDYNQQKEIDQLKNKFDLKELEAEYTEKVRITLACRAEQADDFEELLSKISHKGISFTEQGNGFVTIEK